MTGFKKIKLSPTFQDKKKKNNFGSLKRSKFVKFLSLILIFFLLFILLFLGNNLLKVKEIKVNPPVLSCAGSGSVLKLLKLSGQNMLFIDSRRIERIIKNKFLCVEKIDLTRVFPNEVEVNLSQRKAGAVIKVLNPRTLEKIDFIEATPSSSSAQIDFSTPDAFLGAEFLADINGFIFAEIGDENLTSFFNIDSLPKIYSENIPVTSGQYYKNRIIQNVFEVLDKMKKLSLNISLIKISDDRLLLLSEQKIILSLNKDILKQIASLQLILQKAKIDSRPIELIDLRFDKPVVIYSSKKN